MKKCLILLLLLIPTITFALPNAIITIEKYSIILSNNLPEPSSYYAEIGHIHNGDDYYAETTFFTVLQTDVGNTFELSGAALDQITGLLTNGSPLQEDFEDLFWFIRSYDGGGVGGGANEPSLIWDDHTGASGWDYQGYEISGISLTIYSFIVTNEYIAEHDDFLNIIDFNADLIIDIESVPEPASIYLLGICIVGLIGFVRKKPHK